jgi:hypothetical protein
MYTKLLAVLTIFGFTATSVLAVPTPQPGVEVEARNQPWREFKREALEKESPELALLSSRDSETSGGSEAG